MAILQDLADYLTEETSMTVRSSVLLMSSKNDLPRVRLFTDGVDVHALFNAPAGLFMAKMTNVGKDPFFSEMSQGNIEVDEAILLDATQDFIVQSNWPARKVSIDGKEYTLPRNHVQLFQQIVKEAKEKKKKRR